MGKALALVFGLLSYFVFFGTFLYAIGFVGNILVPKSIDSGTPAEWSTALAVNLILLTIFAVQHSVMARPEFKSWWKRFVPTAIERSVYVLFASSALILLFWQWQPMTTIVWNVENAIGRPVLFGVFAFGWLTVLLSTFMINHFDLFGVRQVYYHSRGAEAPDLGFRTKAFYKLVRHPIMLGFIIAFWATPTMTVGHLLFAGVTTAYILVAIQLEERDLVNSHGETYEAYKRSVGMLVPVPRKGQPDVGRESVRSV
ncbi:MAG TPA: NnrU family protein [Pyrinomonadaceae bacterium]|nr:NnrU family protein [Pyrinomonadaceae bacterium]